MARLIDADALLNRFNTEIPIRPVSLTYDMGTVLKAVMDSPTVDAEPVVRCKDCKYAHMTYDGEVKYCDRISMPDDEGDYGYALYLPGDWFCADGERRDDDGSAD